MTPKKSPAKWGRPASSQIADSDSGGLAVRLAKNYHRQLSKAPFSESLTYLQEVSSGGFEFGKAQLIRPSQNNSFRMQCRLEEEEQRLQINRRSNHVG